MATPTTAPPWIDLLALPGARALIWAGLEHEAGSRGELDALGPRAETWLVLLTATIERLTGELELGAPRRLTLGFDRHALVVAVDPGGGFIAMVADDTLDVSTVLVQLRRWLPLPERAPDDADPP